MYDAVTIQVEWYVSVIDNEIMGNKHKLSSDNLIIQGGFDAGIQEASMIVVGGRC
jgi:hypothetical protein